MSIRTLTAKAIQIAIKNGLTPEDLQSRYKCSEVELKERIQQLYSSGNGKKAKDIYSRLIANRKKARSKSTPTSSEVTLVPASPEENSVDAETLETGEIPEATEPQLNIRPLASLKEEEKELSDRVIQLELDHKALAQCRHVCTSKLRSIQEELDKIAPQLQKLHEQYDEIVAEANGHAEKMNAISAERRELKVALEKVRRDIEEREIVTIFVFADGRIEPDNTDFVIDDEGFKELRLELTERSECSELKVRDVATLARLIVISERAERPLQLFFDNEALEVAFKAIHDA